MAIDWSFGPDSWISGFAFAEVSHVLEGLTCFDDADRQRNPILLREIPWAEIKRTITGWVREFTSR